MKQLITLFKYTTLLAIVLSAIGLIYITLPFFGNKALIVRSGSMQPTIGVGDLVVVSVNPKGNYEAGEIIAYKSAKDNKTLTTHRIISQAEKDGKIFYQTRGDANESTDQVLVPAENVVGSYKLHIGQVGKLVAFAKSNTGLPILIILPALFVILMEVVNIFSELKRQKSEFSPPYSRSSRILGFKAVLPFALSVLLIQSSFAYFSDTETSTNNIFEAADSFGPPIAQTLVVNEFLWNSSCTPNPETKFFIELFNGSSSQINLKDWRFRDADGTVIQISNANAFINSDAYVLITKSNSTFTNCYTNQGGVDVLNLGGNPDFTPSATGGVIRLEMPDGSGGFIVVDRVEYGPILNSGALNTGNDQSIARSPNGVDSALGDTFNTADFVVDTAPSPGVAN